MQTRFFRSGNQIRVAPIDLTSMTEQLPPGLYTVAEDRNGLYLETTTIKFKLPSTVYGEALNQAERIINTYESRSVSTGVLLTGEKGSGKTLLATILAAKMLDQGTPVVMVNTAFEGATFIDFINSLGNCVLLFDEFCKVYGNTKGSGAEATILTILDGANKQKRLAILIENTIWGVSEYLLNRPGRIFYHYEYRKLSKEVLDHYCKTHEVPPKVFSDLSDLRTNMRTFNFDMLQAIVEEYKRYGGSVREHVKVLNIQTSSTRTTWKIVKFTKNSDLKQRELVCQQQTFESDNDDFGFYVGNVRTKEENDDEDFPDRLEDASLYDQHIVVEDRNYRVLDNNLYTIVLEKVEPQIGKYDKYLPNQ